MVKFYLSKIQNGIINPNTKNIWTLDDVPTLWHSKVKKELE